MTFPRRLTPEIMDRPDVPPDAHRKALDGLRRINQSSQVVRHMLPPIAEMAQRQNLTQLRLLDVACGGGDVPVGLAVAAKQLNLKIELNLLDRSPTALAIARATAEKSCVSCTTIQADAENPLPAGSFDVITSSLFLHHLPTPQAVIEFLRSLVALSPRLIVISDLRRFRLGYFSAWLACRILSDSPIVRFDGPVSVRAAWTTSELADFAAAAGMPNAKITRCWPCRILLVWERQ
jgi:2-polyprenyl-3-methyl-5-hydroxy-6-metoxy-1,4-benzoquinol methylase